MKEPKFLSSETIFEKKFAGKIDKELYELEDGRIFDFYRRTGHDVATTLILTEDEQCVLVKQYRYGINDFVTDICGGMIEDGEDPREAAFREMEEETGYTCAPENFVELGVHYVNPARTDQNRHFYLATNAHLAKDQELDDFEDIQVVLEPFEDVYQKVINNEYQEPNFALAVLKYHIIKNSNN